MAQVSLRKLVKEYEGGVQAVKGIDLEIADHEFVVLVGPSGCGKSTTLRMIAGLEEISGGEIAIGGAVVNDIPPRDRDIAMVFQNYALYPHKTVAANMGFALRMVAGLESVSRGNVLIGDRIVNDVPPKARDIAMVFQNYALYPHMSVFDNMAFGLKLQKVSKHEIQQRVREAAGILGLMELLDRKPRALSGGQRQRVAMGRAIVRHPQAFLMDEPLSNLDAKLRVQMRAEIARIQSSLEVTTVYVTHDQIEAMTMGDRVAVIRKGRLQQFDSPQRLYEHPINVFVAGFIGSPAMNLVEATLADGGEGLEVRFAEFRLPVPDDVLTARPTLRARAGSQVVLGIRPEDMEDVSLSSSVRKDAVISAVVDLREAHGSDVMIHFAIAAPPAVTDDVRELAVDLGADALHQVEQRAAAGKTDLVARLNPRTLAQKGQRVDLVVDVNRLHFFDPDTGAAIYD
jgi:multiple sugar transport system ATP-binding protein